jgi:hypothetical protein
MALALPAWLLQPVAFAQSDAAIAATVRACQREAAMSSRLACYDRAFPPVSETADRNDAPASAEARVAAVPAPEPPPQRAAQPAPQQPSSQSASSTIARIVEVEMPSIDTTVFRAEDGRVFVRSNATSVVRWPETPFDVEVDRSMFGNTTYLNFPGRNLRVRVAVRN